MSRVVMSWSTTPANSRALVPARLMTEAATMLTQYLRVCPLSGVALMRPGYW